MVKIKSLDYIITAKHYGGSASAYIRNLQKRHLLRGISVNVNGLNEPPRKEIEPVMARIWQGQWIADCECRGASFVDPDEPIFFCFSCGNRAQGGWVRSVIFPEQREAIEALVLERPVDDMAGLTDNERAGMAKALLSVEVQQTDGEVSLMPLTRSWRPGETVEDLHEQQHDAISKWHRGKEKHGVRQ